KTIESVRPHDAMVFQLPYAPFPEGPVCTCKSYVYDQARAYLHSKTLRCSYAGMRGREADLWQQRIAALPPERFLEAIFQTGFQGLWIDRNAYPDHAASLETQLAYLLH